MHEIRQNVASILSLKCLGFFPFEFCDINTFEQKAHLDLSYYR